MILPIRCFTCNKVIGNKWTTCDKTGYIDLIKQGFTSTQALDKLGLERYCCRRMLLTHVDHVKNIN